MYAHSPKFRRLRCEFSSSSISAYAPRNFAYTFFPNLLFLMYSAFTTLHKQKRNAQSREPLARELYKDILHLRNEACKSCGICKSEHFLHNVVAELVAQQQRCFLYTYALEEQ